MARLPVRDATVDAAMYAALLHYAPINDVIREARRVVRPGGFLVAVDSPMYADRHAQAEAEARSAAYYSDAGFSELAAHYHPIEVGALRTALLKRGFEILRLEDGRLGSRWWERLRWTRSPSYLFARLNERP